MKNRAYLFVVVIFMTACSSMSQKTQIDDNPDQRLSSLLDAHAIKTAKGEQCLGSDQQNRWLTDCRRLLKDLQRLHVEFTKHTDIAMNYAMLEYQYGEPSTAGLVLDQVLSIAPRTRGATLLRTRIALQVGNLPLAHRLADDWFEREPNEPEALEMLAAIHFVEGRYDAATRYLESARRLGAPRWRLAYHHGLLAERQGDWRRACHLYSVARDDRPRNKLSAQRLAGLNAKPGCPSIVESDSNHTM